MNKIPTLFEREYENHRVVKVLDRVTPDLKWVLDGEGTATVKIDGSCCAVINGDFYKRYDCKSGRKPPEGFMPCCEPDPVTGHWPGWVKCSRSSLEDKWFWAAHDNSLKDLTDLPDLPDGTYEAIGPHFQRNPYGLAEDILEPHGKRIIEVERSFEGIREYLKEHCIEGIVFWKDGKPQCKIKRSDFGFDWNR